MVQTGGTWFFSCHLKLQPSFFFWERVGREALSSSWVEGGGEAGY